MKEEESTEQQAPTRNRRRFNSIIGLLWLGFFIGMLFVGVVIAGALFGVEAMGFSSLPSFEELENPQNSLASEIYAADGVLLGKFYLEDRSNIDFDQIPKHLIDALVATEDRRFYDHSGIDFYGLSTAIYRNLRYGKMAGASTISQQLVKNLFTDKASNFAQRVLQKLQEWVIAVKLERSYTKDEILTMYFNTVHFGHITYGIKSASKKFYNLTPSELNVQQSAVLVGMLKASTAYDPIQNPERSKGRRNVVLSQMQRYGFISDAAKDSLQLTELVVDFRSQNHNEGLATYFREKVKKDLKKWSKEMEETEGSSYDIFRDGLKIYTTIDSKLQKYAEEAVAEHLVGLQEVFDKHWEGKNIFEYGDPGDLFDEEKSLARSMKSSNRYHRLRDRKASEADIQKEFETPVKMKVFSMNGSIDTVMSPLDSIRYHKMFLKAAFMAMDPETGEVKAWVGGPNHRHFKFDNVDNPNQVGSTFKPFVYTLYMQQGWSPCQKVPNSPVTFPKGMYGLQKAWSPRGKTGGRLDYKMLTLKTALANSLNWVTAYVMKDVGPEPVVELAKTMGIESEIEAYPSICLGTPAIKLSELVGAYSSYANKGVYNKPIYITHIEDKNGQVIATFQPVQREALNEQTAYVMLNLMKGVVDEGTARRLRFKYGITAEMAGKTGTTNNNSDGWFIGIVPKLVGGVWAGGDEKAYRFRETRLGQGANMALPVWANFLEKVYADEESGISQGDRFARPEARLAIELDCSKYQTGTGPSLEDEFDLPTEVLDSLNLLPGDNSPEDEYEIE